jgi:hypothetical protein
MVRAVAANADDAIIPIAKGLLDKMGGVSGALRLEELERADLLLDEFREFRPFPRSATVTGIWIDHACDSVTLFHQMK